MTRLFDAGAEGRRAAAAKEADEGPLKRARELARKLEEDAQLDETSQALGQALGAVRSVERIKYYVAKKPGCRWQIEHAKVGDDYVLQVFPLRPPKIPVPDVLTLMIATMDTIFPRTVDINYRAPNDKYEVRFYTIRLVGVATMPGWVAATERAIDGLLAIPAW